MKEDIQVQSYLQSSLCDDKKTHRVYVFTNLGHVDDYDHGIYRVSVDPTIHHIVISARMASKRTLVDYKFRDYLLSYKKEQEPSMEVDPKTAYILFQYGMTKEELRELVLRAIKLDENDGKERPKLGLGLSEEQIIEYYNRL